MSADRSNATHDSPQHPDRCSCFAGELSALCDTESVLDAVVRHTDHAVLAVDLDGIVLLWNPACERLSGWSAPEAIGISVGDVLTGTADGGLAGLRAIAASEANVERDVGVKRKDGSTTRVRLNLAPLRDEEGHTCGVLGIALGLEGDERFDHLRREFIDVSAVELRGPLTSVLGYAQLLSASHVLEDPEERRRITRLLDERCTALSELLDDLVLLSGLSERSAPAQSEHVDACDLAGVVIRRANALRPDCDVLLQRGSRPARVLADRLGLEQVLESLIGAASDDAPSACVDVRVSDSASHAVVEIGAASERGRSRRAGSTPRSPRPAATERRAASLRSAVQLRFAEHFAELHDGDVSAAYSAVSGSRFVLRLPLAVPEGAS